MNNQIIQIFLASSEELKEDREQFEIFINRKNNQYIEQGIFLKLVIWEDFLDAMSATRLQDEYNKAIRECDVVVSLFKTKVGQYTEEEVMTAYETFKENNKPLIYTYFKEAQINVSQVHLEQLKSLQKFQNKLRDLGHFYTKYNSVEDLKYKFSEQLIKLIPQLTKKEGNMKEIVESTQPRKSVFPIDLGTKDSPNKVEELTELTLAQRLKKESLEARLVQHKKDYQNLERDYQGAGDSDERNRLQLKLDRKIEEIENTQKELQQINNGK